MVYFDQHIILPPDILQRWDIFCVQINAFLRQIDTIIKGLDSAQLSSLSKQIDKFLRNLDELPSYINVLDKDMEAVVRVVGRFSDALEMLVEVGKWILVALVVLVVMGFFFIKGMRNTSDAENRWIREEMLKRREEVKVE